MIVRGRPLRAALLSDSSQSKESRCVSRRDVFQVPVVSLLQALLQRQLRLPSECAQPADIHHFSGCAIGFGRIEHEVATIIRNTGNQSCEVANRNVGSRPHVDV